MSQAPAVAIRRIYDDDPPPGVRVLIDRLWPRGVSKQDAALELWVADVAPSDELRRWYGHDPDRFETFRKRYVAELQDDGARRTLRDLASRARDDRLVLLTATKDVDHSHAVVLARVIRGML